MNTPLEQLSCSFDWDREFATCDPEYYKWTQWLFIKMFHEGLAYQREAIVNWDPVDQTVLADEQVDHEGKSWRSGAKVEKRPLKQWFLRTTRYSKQLYEGLDDPSLKNWRDVIKLQKNWIGECNGTNIDVNVEGHDNLYVTAWTDLPQHIDKIGFIGICKGHILDRKEYHSHGKHQNLNF